MILFWMLPFCFVSAFEASDPNCLRDNLGALDAEFSFKNRFENHTQVNGDDFAKHISLLTTRFKRAHQFVHFNSENMGLLKQGISLIPASARENLELFLSVPYLNMTNNLSTAVHEFNETFEGIKDLNSGNGGPVVALYLKEMKTYSGMLEAVLTVFGLKENSTFPLGQVFKDCTSTFKKKPALSYLQRLDFITCDFPVVNKKSPEESADYVIKTCDNIRDMAVSIKVTAEIKCRVGYPSFGNSSKGIVGTLLNFQKFWCRIVSNFTQEPNHTQIIMMSAFDVTPKNYKLNSTDLYAGKFYGGWWRRRVTTSYGANSFVEKVEELRSTNEHGNCTGECDVCNSNEPCCEGRTCAIDNSFQPFENNVKFHVFQSRSTACAPRFHAQPKMHTPPPNTRPSRTTSIVTSSPAERTRSHTTTSKVKLSGSGSSDVISIKIVMFFTLIIPIFLAFNLGASF